MMPGDLSERLDLETGKPPEIWKGDYKFKYNYLNKPAVSLLVFYIY